ncbi:MAG: WGxxGxxG-CTERM domain-containing protein [Methylacidiphilales bacterium]|nr:WGxxGxxG-CTERM domain-containing protein [Candidatus Methylacidiphilales bacterium]NJR18948.1 WGxxGxxG-CTERM domain-containing protein [Calothrix sp. CSU_2_0]
MKNYFSKAIGATALVASLAIMPLSAPVQAQTNTDGTTTTPNTGVYNDSNYGDRNFDWGWLGLLGLIGLAGLAGKKRNEEPTRYRDPNAVGTSTYRE